MKKYEIQQNGNNEMIISFYFNKKSLIIPSIFLISFLAVVVTRIQPKQILEIWGSLLIATLCILYLILYDYFEWNKNKYHKINIKDDDLFINNVFHCKLYKLQSVNIAYANGKHNVGWMVYLNVFPNSSYDHTIKKRLKEKEAHEIAAKISLFLDRNIKIK
jgi:hypothetical protein